MTVMHLANPNQRRLVGHILDCQKYGLSAVQAGVHADRPGAVIVGTAPSFMEESSLRKVRKLQRKGFIVFAIKAAVEILPKHGIAVDYSVNMDPGAEEVGKTPLDWSVTYLLALSCHPALFAHVVGGGCRAQVYASACGIDSEEDIYQAAHGLAQGSTMCGGFTVTNRALALAKFMGLREVWIAGAQFGWRESQSYYAPGIAATPGNKGPEWCDQGKIDGTPWHTKLDLMASAVTIARQMRDGTVHIIGDSLAASLARQDRQDPTFLDRVVTKALAGGASVPLEAQFH